MTDEPDQMSDPAVVMASLAALLIERLRVLQSPHDDVITLQSHYAVALWAVAKFLDKAGEKDLALKIIVLEDALVQLRHGTVADVVRPTSADTRGPDGILLWSQRHEVVKGLECILRSRKMKTIESAAKYIAKNYPAFDRLKRNTDASLPTSIASWRSGIRKGKVPGAEDMLAHERSFFEQYGDLPPTEMFELAKQLLAQAAERTTKAM
jgi:hypothetical protein